MTRRQVYTIKIFNFTELETTMRGTLVFNDISMQTL